MEDSIDDMNFFARSLARIRLLDELYEHEHLEKEALRERVDASRTTIQRNLDALERRGWIRSDGRTYRISHSGEPVTEQFLMLLNTIRAAKRLQPFLEWVPSEEFDLELHSLATADVTVSDENDPYAPVNRHVELLKWSDRFRGLLPAVGLLSMTSARDRVVRHGSTHELVVDRAIVDTLRDDDNYREVVEDLLASERAEILVSDDSIPFYLGVADGVVQIGVGDDTGVPRSLVESEAPDVREWAERVYDEYRATAKSLPSLWSSPTVPE